VLECETVCSNARSRVRMRGVKGRVLGWENVC